MVARYAGDDELADRLAAVIAVHQANEEATAAALVFSAILERMALHGATMQVHTTQLKIVKPFYLQDGSC